MATDERLRRKERTSSAAMTNTSDAGDALPLYDKLHNLTLDDKMENALLRSRIDEQSQLIMILKNRADEAIEARKHLEEFNSNLQGCKDGLEDQLREVSKKCEMLDARFFELASNHEEMIKIKDDYKKRNTELFNENLQLSDENKRLFSGAIVERDRQISKQEQQISDMERKFSELMKQKQALREQIEQTEKSKAEVQGQYSAQLNDANEKIKTLQSQMEAMMSRVHQVEASHSSSSDELKAAVEKLTKEKEELLQQTVSRGKLIQEKQSECKQLTQKVEATERAMREMKTKFEQEAALVSVSHQVSRLRKVIDDLQAKHDTTIMEFDAYKKHSQSLLEQEKELNARLRHFVI